VVRHTGKRLEIGSRGVIFEQSMDKLPVVGTVKNIESNFETLVKTKIQDRIPKIHIHSKTPLTYTVGIFPENAVIPENWWIFPFGKVVLP
jgi:hypothetical protein